MTEKIEEILKKDKHDFNSLVEIMKILRSPGGCPWDREQDHKSIRKNLLEETYEAAEAIDNDDSTLLCEELGDVMLQVVFHSQISEEEGSFDINDVINGVCTKLIVRHPHIFSNVKADTSEEVLNNWDKIKKFQKGNKSTSEAMASVSKALPALVRGDKLQQKAAKVGFDFDGPSDAMKKVYEEFEEVKAALEISNKENLTEEIGDLLFSVVNVARLLGIDSEEAMTRANEKFYSRFKKTEEMAMVSGVEMRKENIDSLNEIWEKIKKL